MIALSSSNHKRQPLSDGGTIDRETLRHQILEWGATAVGFGDVSRCFAARLYPLFPHKTAATCAGLGWVGKSGLLINKQYGPHLIWATVLTDPPLLTNKPTIQSHCLRCARCVDYCPSRAIHGKHWHREQGNIPFINLAACSDQLQKNKQDLGRAVCGLCVPLAPPREIPLTCTHWLATRQQTSSSL